MEITSLSKKELTVLKVSTCVLKLESTKGHLKWKVTDLETKSKISRSLIYRYLGSSKEEILKNSLRVFTFEFYGFGSQVSIPFSERIRLTREFLLKNHEVILFYQKWRTQDSWLQKEFIAIETVFQKNLKELLPHLSDEAIRGLHACLHGLVTAPFLNPEDAAFSARYLSEVFGFRSV